MAEWATPADVRAYSSYPEVDGKTDPELEILLKKAEAFIRAYTCSDWADATADELDQLKLIDCALVEMFVLGQGNTAVIMGAFKSERIGEYSYTLKDASSTTIANPTGDPYIDAILFSMRRCGGGRPGIPFVAYGPSRKKRGLPPGVEVDEINREAVALVMEDGTIIELEDLE